MPGNADRGFLITHESEHLEFCLVTFANRAFVRDKRNSATIYRHMDTELCQMVELHFTRKGDLMTKNKPTTRELARMRAQGMTQAQIGEKYGVSHTTGFSMDFEGP